MMNNVLTIQQGLGVGVGLEYAEIIHKTAYIYI